jgi:predicted DNA binding CopG/RHH family protein
MKKRIPRFASEEKEREFWAREDSADYLDWTKARRVVLSELKPSVKTISLRLPAHLLADLKLLANKRDVPYQSLLKMFLADRVRQELNSSARKSSKSNSTLQRTVRSASRR